MVGAALCALGLAGITYGLIEQPLQGGATPVVPAARRRAPLFLGVHRLGGARTRIRCSRWRCSGAATSAIGNIETFAMYGGPRLLFFFLVLFLQQVAGYSALEAGPRRSR